MSQYLQFFIRKGDNFVSMTMYGRSSKMYQAFEDAPFEKVARLGYDELNSAREWLKYKYDCCEKRIADLDKRIHLIATFNNSAEEKSEAIAEVMEEMREYEEELDEISGAIHRCLMLDDVIEEYAYEKAPDGLYYGIEVGYEIEDDMIMN